MEQRDSTGWAFVAALAFYDGLSSDRLSERLQLKWPNDILLDGRKMAGLLVEADGGEPPWVVIGFGANLARAPRIEGRRLACLAEYAAVCEPRVVAERVLNALAFWRQVWNREGFAEIRRSWLARSLPVGTPLVVSVGSTYSEGLFMGIGEGGELLLDVKGKQGRLFTGEVFYGGSAVSRMDAGRASGR